MLYVQTDEDPTAEFGDGATGMRPAGFTAPPIAPPPSGRRGGGGRRWRQWRRRCQGSPDARVTGQTQTGTDGRKTSVSSHICLPCA